MTTIENLKVTKTWGWRSFIGISDRQCRKHGLPKGSIVNPGDPYHIIYYPQKNGVNMYINSGFRANNLIY